MKSHGDTKKRRRTRTPKVTPPNSVNAPEQKKKEIPVICQRIKYFREKKGLEQKDLAKELGIIGCRIPRGADCENGWKCREGEYCNALEICCVTKEEYEKGWIPSFGYFDKSEGCILFDHQEQATQYMEKIKPDNS